MKNVMLFFFALGLISTVRIAASSAQTAAHDRNQCPVINGTFGSEDASQGSGVLQVKTVVGNPVTTIEIIGMEDGFEDPAVPLDGKTMLLGEDGSTKTFRTASCQNQKAVIEMKLVRKDSTYIAQFGFSLDSKGNLLIDVPFGDGKKKSSSVTFIRKN